MHSHVFKSKLILSFFFLLLLISCRKEASNQVNKYSGYVNTEILIPPEQALELMDSGQDILLLDIRSEGNYRRSHIRGAYNIFRTQYLTRSADGRYGAMNIDRERMAVLLGEYGARPGTIIMLYDDLMGIDAARIWWMLTMFGHSNVRLIDGGIQNWEAQEMPLTRDIPTPRPQTRYAFSGSADYSSMASFEDVLQSENNPSAILVDVRSRGEYTGAMQLGGAPVGGTIPWAVWLPHSDLVRSGNLEDKTVLPAEELRQILTEHGITPEKEVILFCHSSLRANISAFILTELLGYPNVKTFDDAWMGWANRHVDDPDRYPVMRGE